ncbi:MAG: DNA polymerase III subunit gamma/tau C-terminal domain-containing protein, partial [Rhodanobacteraceae bacterium]
VLDGLAGKLDPEDVQVWYQFALNGRRDLPLAPDVRSGFEMTLLRMLAFRNDDKDGRAASVSPRTVSHAPASAVAHTAAASRATTPPRRPQPSPASATVAATPHIGGIADWEAWIRLAGLGGPAGLLAQHALPKSFEGEVLTLALKPEHEILCSDALCRQLQEKLGEAIGRKVRVRIVHESVAETPAARAAKARSDAQAVAERALAEDPIIQDMQRQFGAEIIPESIRPAGNQA